MHSKEYTVKSIGKVGKTDELVALRIWDEFWGGTLNLDKFSHLVVLWWIDGKDTVDARSTLQVTPKPARGITEALSGVFATRSPSRPNPIGLSIVRLIELNPINKEIIIDQIDANHDSPILDLKPYMPTSDKVERAIVPEWFSQLKARYY